jgi:YVTN family beta-propeller protein
MLRRALLFVLPFALGAAVVGIRPQTLLPSGWRLVPPQGAVADTGTMPQGIALSPDGSMVAIVESGVAPPALRILDAGTLKERRVIPLKGAFGKPVWRDAQHVAVAGGSADVLYDADVASGALSTMPVGKNSWPAAIAIDAGGTLASVNDGDGSVTIGGARVKVGDHPSDAVFSRDGATLYVAVRAANEVAVVDVRGQRVAQRIQVGLHPAALAISRDGSKLYVAESDDDAVGVIDTATNKKTADISVAMNQPRLHGIGASPNALFVRGGALFVSLGAQNAVGVIRDGRLTERIPAGRYPTGVAVASNGTLYVVNGQGERAPANPQFNPLNRKTGGYVGEITVGSVREVPSSAYRSAASETSAVIGAAKPQWTPAPQTVLRANGPIKHVIYIIKENRSYDQILGDVAGADGDAALAMFGKQITPNQHAIAERFGIFDNAYVNALVSADGHNWTDAAFANDYVERFWPPNYGGRRDPYDFQDGGGADVPHNGYLWDAAKRARVTYRDYGEDIDDPGHGIAAPVNTFPGLAGHFDPRYIGWDLSYSDLSRYAEWQREFDAFVRAKNLPQLEIVYLPNDHTSGTAPGHLTPQAYIGTNDLAVGKLVEHVSHSPYWRSTAIFILEDDAQNGPDHVSDQRSTFYIASPYARGGLRHEHYSTAAFVRTIELVLGLQPLSIYDATARPLYDAFTLTPLNAKPYTAIQPGIDLHALNTKAAYRSAISAKLDFSKPDAVDPRVLNDIIEHSAQQHR